MIKIKIIIDREDRSKGRTCFWETCFADKTTFGKDSSQFKIEYVSIADTLHDYFLKNSADAKKFSDYFLPDELFSHSKTHVIIINWDSINNDPVYGSDRAFQFFEHYRKGLDSWVKDGGILIIEAQSAQWTLVQDAYRIFDDSIKTTKEEGVHGYKGIAKQPDPKINPKIHPILKKTYDENTFRIDLPENNYCCRHDWYPVKSENKRLESGFKGHPVVMLYQGWFDEHSTQWDPIIFADEKRARPIMLCRIPQTYTENNSARTYKGTYIITTMYLGSSSLYNLIKNILDLAGINLLNEYYYNLLNGYL